MRVNIDGDTQIYGLLGSNIAYTKSPAMHNRAAQSLGINAVYVPLQIDTGSLSSFLNAAWNMNFGGFNVTQPHKESVAQLCAQNGQGSVNTLVRGNSNWSAASTDGEGFAAGLGRMGRELSSFSEIAFIGAGGAVTAVLEYLALKSKDLPDVHVLRRASSRDNDLKKVYSGSVQFHTLGVSELTAVLSGKKDATLLVQASSAPLKGDDLATLVPALAAFKGAVVDMVYSNPSKLYFAALNADLDAVDGEPMLIEQARAAQKLWWGKSASYEEMLLALRGK